MAPGFGSDFVVLIEQNRRRSESYVEVFVIEARRNMARRRDAKMGYWHFPCPLNPVCNQEAADVTKMLIKCRNRQSVLQSRSRKPQIIRRHRSSLLLQFVENLGVKLRGPVIDGKNGDPRRVKKLVQFPTVQFFPAAATKTCQQFSQN